MLCHCRALHGDASIRNTTDSRGRADGDASLLREAVWIVRCLVESPSVQNTSMRAMGWSSFEFLCDPAFSSRRRLGPHWLHMRL
jgi:hypothetical protein